MITFIRWLSWLLKGKPTLTYTGYNCGCCGRWINATFTIPKYRSHGEWWDTVGLCHNYCEHEKPRVESYEIVQ